MTVKRSRRKSNRLPGPIRILVLMHEDRIRPEFRGKRKWRNLPVSNNIAENRDRRITPWNRARISRLTR